MRLEETILYILKEDQKEIRFPQNVSPEQENEMFWYLQRNRLIPLFYEKRKGSPEQFSLAFLQRLKEANRSEMMRSMKMEAVFLEVIRLFARNNIQAVVIKGFSLSTVLYGHHTHRPMSDLDFLVHPALYKETVSVLLAAEATQKSMLNAENNTNTGFENTFWFSGVKVELHHHLMNPSFLNSLDREIIFNNTTECKILGETCMVLAPEMRFFYLLHHFSRHMDYKLARMVWLVDIHYFLKHYGEKLHWNRFFEFAKLSNSTRDLYRGLYLSTELFGDELPENVPEFNDVARLVKDYFALCRGDISPAGDIGSFKMISQIKGIKNKSLYALNKMFPSSDFVQQHYMLPDKKHIWIYYLRLFRKRGIKVFNYFTRSR